MKAEQKQREPRGGVWDRLRAFFGPRRPPDPSIAYVMAQWAEYELIFNDILRRLNAQLSRQAKAEKAQLERFMRESGDDRESGRADAVSPVFGMTKAELRAHFGPQRPGPRLPRNEVRDELAETGS